MDEIDRKIIELLKKDAGMPLSRIADLIGIPRPTAYLRFNKMKEAGVIKGFSIILEKEGRGQAKAAIVKVKDYLISEMGPRAAKKLGEKLAKRAEVIFAARVSRTSILVIWEGMFNPREYEEVVEVDELMPEIYKGPARE
jgi:DNA-binding Lrp family transcriptional regulator